METMVNETAYKGNEPKVSLFNHALRYGLLTGIAYILLSLLFYSFGLSQQSWVGYASFVVLIAGIIMGTVAYRDKHSGGYLSYGRSLATGVLISLVAGIVMAVYSYLFFKFFEPGMIDSMMDVAAQSLADKGMAEDQIDQAMSITGKFMTPIWMAVISIFSLTFYGTIFSLITSIFIKKEDNSFDAAFPEN
ncbi:MAG: DUF4199 domain-containing protein [Lentimicrobium sp.]|jgi:hypothetical protein|nr:DUF4199 domain-containing protein [Lentimicrobium sp.]